MRKQVRRHSVLLSSLIAVSLVAAACGDDDDTTTSVEPSSSEAGGDASTTEAGEPTDVDPAGVVTFGERLISGQGVHFDPIQTRSEGSNIQWIELVFGTLMRQAEDGSIQPWMAEGAEIVDPQTVKITLRPGITFTDGSAYDAEAVKTSLLRSRFESATPTVASGLHEGMKALTSVDVVDPLTVVVHLDRPVAAVFIDAMQSIWGAIQSPKQIAESPAEIDTKPVGAGPFVLAEFLPEQRLSLRKNVDFWDADNWQLGGVDVLHTPAGTPVANGLLADTLDIATQVPIASLDALKNDKDLTTDVAPIRWSALLLCSGKPPFDNEAVRKAVQIGIDREQYNELGFDGLGTPAYGAFAADDPRLDPAVKDALAYDPDGAKKLLADASVGDVTFDVVMITTNNTGRQGEIVQAQLQKIGIKTNLVTLDNVYADWIEPQKPGAMLTAINGQPVGGYIFFSQMLRKGGSLAYCGVDETVATGLVSEAVQYASDDPKSIEAFKQANAAFVDSAYHIPLILEPIATTWNTSRVGGTPSFIDTGGQPRVRFESIYVKS